MFTSVHTKLIKHTLCLTVYPTTLSDTHVLLAMPVISVDVFRVCQSRYARRDRTYREQEDMLREHKPPAIRRIRISDFGLPDLKRDPDRHQNCITWSLSHALPLQKNSSKSVYKFASNLTDRQTDRQTNRQTNRPN